MKYTLWKITFDGDAIITDFNSKSKAIKAAENAIMSGKYDVVYIDVDNGEEMITRF